MLLVIVRKKCIAEFTSRHAILLNKINTIRNKINEKEQHFIILTMPIVWHYRL